MSHARARRFTAPTVNDSSRLGLIGAREAFRAVGELLLVVLYLDLKAAHRAYIDSGPRFFTCSCHYPLLG